MIAALFVLVQLTSPGGDAIWFVRDSVAAVTQPIGCGQGSGSMIITTGGNNICVKETAAEAVTKLAKAKDDSEPKEPWIDTIRRKLGF